MNLNAKIKVYNDINNNLVNFFTELRENKELANYLKSIEEQPWLLSYNNEDFILNLYSEKNNQEIYLDLFGKPQLRKDFTNFGINGRNNKKSKRVELFYYN